MKSNRFFWKGSNFFIKVEITFIVSVKCGSSYTAFLQILLTFGYFFTQSAGTSRQGPEYVAGAVFRDKKRVNVTFHEASPEPSVLHMMIHVYVIARIDPKLGRLSPLRFLTTFYKFEVLGGKLKGSVVISRGFKTVNG